MLYLDYFLQYLKQETQFIPGAIVTIGGREVRVRDKSERE